MIATSCDINPLVSPKTSKNSGRMRAKALVPKPSPNTRCEECPGSANHRGNGTTQLAHPCAQKGGSQNWTPGTLAKRCLTYKQRAPMFGRPQSDRHAEHKKAHNTLAYKHQISTPLEHHRAPAQMRPFPSWHARYALASVTPLVIQIVETRVPCCDRAPCNINMHAGM